MLWFCESCSSIAVLTTSLMENISEKIAVSLKEVKVFGNFRNLKLGPIIPRERRPSLVIQNGRCSQNRHEFQQTEFLYNVFS